MPAVGWKVMAGCSLLLTIGTEGDEAVIMSAQKKADQGNLLRSYTPYVEKDGEEYMNDTAGRALHQHPQAVEARVDGRSGSYCESHAGRSCKLP